MKYSTLDLGDGSDARLWEAGCQKIGMSPENSLIGSSVTAEQLATFFGGLPDWVYFSGHFAPVTLYGDFAAIDFKPDRITVVTEQEPSRELLKNASGFRLHELCSVVIWGACSVLRDEATIRILRQLFWNPLLLGYAAQCGVEINKVMLNRFFQRIQPGQNGPDALLGAWMQAANSFYGGGPIEHMFRAVDVSGQEWKIVKAKIVKGRKFIEG
ncbi:MAG: hypothetical protein IPP10_17095 [Candidatus Competibacteraceae bacterium]|nr:hypothetical protein [Candidatus Competibacteraceae bacterium]MBK7985071.1 hypothetical protein [Candidatus Competibacteraceae bacterium]MBK8895851.1 hypothetical protein [Candidatus Competibacteraceae bacterium]MBK8962943.1 hypothetical protein [Candidatus Competibacteraceae bacterium]MBK9953122.1 hypothetical protein [Candidatus Competibacteraceae bacterium]